MFVPQQNSLLENNILLLPQLPPSVSYILPLSPEHFLR